MNKIIEKYIENKNPDFGMIVFKLSEIILSTNKSFGYAIKWGRLTFGLNEDFHHWICYIDILKNNVSLVFHFGGLLEDKNKLFISGTSKFFRKLEFKNISEINESVIKDFLNQAVGKLDFFKKNWKKVNSEK